MATSINSYSVNFGMDASGYVNGANLSRQETRALIKDIEAARTPSENFAREQDRLTEALNKGAISQATYQRLLEQKRKSLGLAGEEVDKTTKLLNRYTVGLTAVAAAGATIVAGGVAFVSHLRDVQGELDATIKSATKLGLTFDEMSSLRFAASEIGGSDAATVDGAVKKMQINIARALQGDETIKEAFQQLGIDAATVLDKGPLEAVKRIADAFQGVSNQADRLRLATEIFGKSGADLVDTLSAGRDVIEESTAFQEKWNSLTDAQAIGVESNNDAWGRVFFMVEGITNKLAAEFAPAMQLVADYTLQLGDDFNEVDSAISSVVDNTVLFVGFLRDAYELAAVTQTTLANIAALNFSAVVDGVSEALDFGSGERALEALNAKREQLEAAAAAKAEERERNRQAMLLEGLEEIEKVKDTFADEERRKAEAADRAKTQQLQSSLKLASKYLEDQASAAKKIRDDIAKGPGSGMEAGSAEAARFMADQVNKALAADASPDAGKPTEQQLLEEAKRQSVLAEESAKREEMQVALLRKLTEKPDLIARVR